MNLHDLVTASTAVAAASGRLEKIALLADLLRSLEPAEVPIAIGFLTGWPRQGKLGIGWATLEAAKSATIPEASTLSIVDVDVAFTELQAVKGKASAAQRRQLLADLMSRATAEEQRFLYALA